MFNRKWALALLMALAAVAAASPGVARAAELQTDAEITVPRGVVLEDDLYAFGGAVRVRGTVRGDLVAAAGTVEVDGLVTQDLVVTAGSVVVRGVVEDDVRALAGNVEILGTVKGDVIAAAGTLRLSPEASVGGDVILGAGDVRLEGSVGGEVRAGVGTMVLAGPVAEDVVLRVGERLEVRETARVRGDLRYTGREEARIPDGAVMGEVRRQAPTVRIFTVEAQDSAGARALRAVVGAVQRFLAVLLVGLAVAWAFPQTLDAARRTLVISPWRSLGLGIVVLVAAPVAIGVVAGVAVFLTGSAALPLAVAPGAVYFGLLFLATPVVAYLVGGLALRLRGVAPSLLRELAVGAGIMAVVGMVPVLNSAVGTLTLLFGFGAWLLLLWRRYAPARAQGRL